MPDEVANIDNKHVPLKTLSHQTLAIEMFDFLTDFELDCSCLIFLGSSLVDLEQD